MERMKKKKMVAIAFSFLLITFPLQVFAAGSDLTKEITLTVKNEGSPVIRFVSVTVFVAGTSLSAIA